MCINEEKYRHEYEDLQSLMVSAFTDLYTLKAIGSFVVPFQTEYSEETCFVLNHLTSILKRDLFLSVYKMMYDSDEGTNSLIKLNAELHKSGYTQAQLIKSDIYRKIENDAKHFRDKLIAHNDAERVLNTIKMDDLEAILRDARHSLNACCIQELSPQVTPFSNRLLMHIQLNTHLGFAKLISGARRIERKE